MDRTEERSRLSTEVQGMRRSAVVRMTGVVYGLTLVSIAIVFAVSSALQTVHYKQDAGRPIFLEVFQIYMYAMAIAMLACLQIFVCCQRRKEKMLENLDVSAEHTAVLQEDSKVVIPSKDEKHGTLEKTSPRSRASPSPPPPKIVEVSQVSHLGEDVPGATYDGDGVNLYLRIGVIVFGAGSMIDNGFHLAQLYQDGHLTFDCLPLVDVVVTGLQMFFTFFQAFCVFKLHKIVVRTNRGFFRFIFVHLMATNFLMWLFSAVHNIVKNLIVQQALEIEKGKNETMVECSFMRNLSSRASPFLHPCSVQYALICMMMAYKMYQQMNTPYIVERCSSSSGSSSGSFEGMSIETQRLKASPAVGCDKTHKGLFLGLLVLVITVVAISCFFVFLNSSGPNSKLYATLIYFTLEYFLLALACISTLIAMLFIRRLSFVSSSSGRIFKAEKILLVFSYPGVVILKGFYIMALGTELARYFKNDPNHGFEANPEGFEMTDENIQTSNLKLLLEILSTCSNGGVLLHAILQTGFIIDALNREVSTVRQRISKPGRSVVAFLLLCNLSLFFTAIFEEERTETKLFFEVFFDKTTWHIISCLTVPLLIFFRFLSVVCLLTVWKSTYFPRS